jgi:hypothetical protein
MSSLVVVCCPAPAAAVEFEFLPNPYFSDAVLRRRYTFAAPGGSLNRLEMAATQVRWSRGRRAGSDEPRSLGEVAAWSWPPRRWEGVQLVGRKGMSNAIASCLEESVSLKREERGAEGWSRPHPLPGGSWTVQQYLTSSLPPAQADPVRWHPGRNLTHRSGHAAPGRRGVRGEEGGEGEAGRGGEVAGPLRPVPSFFWFFSNDPGELRLLACMGTAGARSEHERKERKIYARCLCFASTFLATGAL